MNNRVKYIRLLLEHFWERFYHEYTVGLRERMTYDKTKRNDDKLVLGDVVIIRDYGVTPRSKLKHGRVEKLIKGRDQVVRGAILSICTNGRRIPNFKTITKTYSFRN